jgi:putative nucleotidyltransferase with HDIG domain
VNNDYVIEIFPQFNSIKDLSLKEKAVEAWLSALNESDWDKIEDMPWIPGVAEFITNVDHCRGTANLAMALSKALVEQEGVELNVDYIITGAVLHDVGKLLEYSSHGGKTEIGRFLVHSQLGANICMKVDLPAEVTNIVQYHNTPGEIPVRTHELEIIRAMDGCHADSMLRKHANMTIHDVFSGATPNPPKNR